MEGAAARTIGALLFADYARSEILLPVVRAMMQDPSQPVRSCVMYASLPVLNRDRDKAVNLFVQKCESAEAVLNC